jgi:Spy/CpxP family protein refolding chaperone
MLAPPFARADEAAMQSSTPPIAAPNAPVQTHHKQGKSEAGEIVQLVEEALSTIDLRADQSDALQKIGDEVDLKVAAIDDAKRDFLGALATQVAAGSIDESALDSQMKKVEDAAAAAEPVLRRSLEKIHDVLDPAQRKEFVAGFKDAVKKRDEASGAKARIDELEKTLGLTTDQKSKITSILEENDVAKDIMRARAKLVLAAFPGDAFSLDELLPAGFARDRTRRMLHRITDEARRICDVLTPDQRTKAAKMLHDKATPEASEAHTTNTGGEHVGSTAQPLWAGRAVGVGYGGAVGYGAVGYRRSVGYGFGYGAGYGGYWF